MDSCRVCKEERCIIRPPAMRRERGCAYQLPVVGKGVAGEPLVVHSRQPKERRVLTGTFDELTPDVCIDVIEEAYQVPLNGLVSPYPSYVNRVFGMGQDEGNELIAKFYRPGRWSRSAIEEEHRFLMECRDAEIPVAAPIENAAGETISAVTIESASEDGLPQSGSTHTPASVTIYCALFPKMGGRNFDPESDEDWLRLGSLIGRLHVVGQSHGCSHRVECLPSETTASYIDELLAEDVVHPECREEFVAVARETVERISPSFDGVRFQRLHGDFHRGNVLDRVDEGLMVIDFDDMMHGPVVQDFWLLLPDYVWNSSREITMLVEGYEEFLGFDREEIELIEPLRFMRMIYFLTWRSRQRHDYWFKQALPDWGTKQFWIKELEDLRTQSELIG